MNMLVHAQHPFDQAISLGGEPGCLSAKVSESYQNMVGPFGGVTAATMLQSIMIHPDRVGSPVSLTVNFLGPIKGEALEIIPRLLRANRSNQHWTIELMHNNEVCGSATAVFATRRPTWTSLESTFPEHAGKPEDHDLLPPLPGLTPWVSQYDMRFVGGNPFLPSSSTSALASAENIGLAPSESLLWMADKPARKLDFASLTALADAFFSRVVIRRKKMGPIGTVTMTIHFHISEDELAELDHKIVLGNARASRFSDGYFDQSAELWSPDQQLLVTTTQMVYFKD